MNLGKSKIFLIFCLAFIVGVFLGKYINYQIMAITAMILVIFGTLGYQNKTVLIFSIAGVVMLLGAWRFITDYRQNDLAQFYEQKVWVTGAVASEPDVRSDKTYLTLGQVRINDQILESKLLVSVGLFPQYHYGQKLKFETKILEPKEFEDFSYKNYLSRFGIDAVAYFPKVQVEPGNSGNKFKFYILKFKQKFVEKINLALPEPQASFLGGLLLGARKAIPQDLLNQFNITGTSHIVAVSGYNITIIAQATAAFFAWFGLKKRLSFIISLLMIFVFVLMTGATASVIRAGIMGALLLVAFNIGRVYNVTNVLVLAAAAMLAINPQILAFDIGFQLSFAALLGIVYLIPIIEPYFLWVPQMLRPYLLATLSAQIFTLPILLVNFGTLSLIAVPVNVLVLIAVPITMLFGFLTGLAGLLWIKLTLPFAGVTWLLLTYMLKVVELASSLPFASLQIQLSWIWLIVFYLLFAVILIYHYQWKLTPKNS